MTAEPIAIIGLGALFPKAADANQYWANISGGIDGIEGVPASHWRPQDFYDADQKRPDHTYADRGGFIPVVPFEPMKYGIPPHTIEATDTSQLLALHVADQALRDAGYPPGHEVHKRTSTILGVTGALELVIPLGARLGHPLWRRALQEAGVDPDTAEDVVERISHGYVPWQEASFPGLLGNVVAGRIANKLDLHGTNCVVDAACGSSLSALHLAVLELQAGRCEICISGGVDTFNDIFMYMCFSKTPALSATGDVRPFSADGDGTMLGEGVGTVVLKRLSDAQRDGDRIYSVIRGVGTSSDGKGSAIYAPSNAGQARCLRDAHREADVTPDTIQLVEAHGTGTKAGDATELRGLIEVFGSGDHPHCALGSVKSMIGHTKAAAGMAGLIKATLALHHKVLPPTAKVSAPNPAAAGDDVPFYLSTSKRPWLRPTWRGSEHPRRAGVSAFGFGGSNFHAILEEHGSTRGGVDWNDDCALLAVNGDTTDALQSQLGALPDSWENVVHAAAASRRVFTVNAQWRLVAVLTPDTWRERLANAQQRLRSTDTAGEQSWSLPGVHCGSGAAPGGIAFCFPGQGSQYPGMLRDWACRFPEALDALQQAADACAAIDERVPLIDRIYPLPDWQAGAAQRQQAALTDTRFAQPALGALGCGLTATLSRFDIRPDAAIGHSYGELPALHAAGVIHGPTLAPLSVARGQAMAAAAGDEAGSMAALSASPEQCDDLLRTHGIDAVIANRNAPQQTVVSGGADAIARVLDACRQAGLRAKELPVAAAFHSPLVAQASERFAEHVTGIDWQPARVPVISNTTATAYPSDPGQARTLLGQQLAQPVRFSDGIEALYEQGVRTFIEVGPKRVLSGLIGATLAGRPHAAVALDRGRDASDGILDLADALAQIAARGHAVDLSAWCPHISSRPPAPATGLVVPLSGANHVTPRDPLPMREAVMDRGRSQDRPAPVNADNATNAMDAGSGRQQAAVPIPGAHATNTAEGSITRSTATAASAKPRPPAPMSAPPTNSSPSSSSNAMTDPHAITALQQLMDTTAKLHEQFLAGQQEAVQALVGLTGSQQAQSGASAAADPPPARPAASAPLASSPPPVPASKTTQPVPAPVTDASPPVPAGSHHDRETDNTPQTTAAQTASNADGLAEDLLSVVADKTGYPTDMIGLDMDIDAELGIDSIKRVEILAALSERRPDLPQVQPDELGRLRTLQEVLDVVAPAGGSPVPDSPSHKQAPLTTTTATDGLAEDLLSVVADKTGYPADMIGLEMDIDAELGIDSIKRVEILAALSERRPDLPQVQPDELGRLRTLQEVLDTVAPHMPSAMTSSQTDSEAAAPTGATDGLAEDLLRVVADKTGYPADMIGLEMDIDAELGIDSIKRVEILAALSELRPDLPQVQPDELGRLRTLQAVLDTVAPAAQSPEADSSNREPVTGIHRERAAAQPLHVLVPQAVPCEASADQQQPLHADAPVWITRGDRQLATALKSELQDRGISVKVIDAAKPPAMPTRLQALICTLSPKRPTSDQLAHLVLLAGAARERLVGGQFVTIARMDGAFGLNHHTDIAQPLHGALAGLAKTAAQEWAEVRCLALDVAGDWRDTAAIAGRVVGELATRGAPEIGLRPRSRHVIRLLRHRPAADAHQRFGSEDVVLITGGARGVTAAVAHRLARPDGPLLALIGRSPLHDEPDWLRACDDRSAIQQALRQRDDSLTSPKQLQEACRRVLAQREVRSTLARIEAAGGRAIYLHADVTDQTAITAAVQRLRRDHGAIAGLIHGAGVLDDRILGDLDAAGFQRVMSTKVDGLQTLLGALAEDLRLVVCFSSTTARLGRRGQAAYSMANEVLNKTCQQLAHQRGIRALAVNWGPWDGGMVDDSLARIFANEGIGLIPQDSGAAWLAGEIDRDGPVELVVLAGEHLPPGLVVDEDLPATAEVPVVSATLSVEQSPVLRDHVIDGKAVVPMALHLELLARAAQPGPLSLHHIQLLQGITLAGDETAKVVVDRSDAEDGGLSLHVRRNEREHVRAVAHAGSASLHWQALPIDAAWDDEPYAPGNLFHGPALQVISRIDGGDRGGMDATVQVPAETAPWLGDASDEPWRIAPPAVDAAWQALILWHRRYHGSPCLPSSCDELLVNGRQWPERVRMQIRIIDDDGNRVRADAAWLDDAGRPLAIARGLRATASSNLDAAFAKNQLVTDV